MIIIYALAARAFLLPMNSAYFSSCGMNSFMVNWSNISSILMILSPASLNHKNIACSFVYGPKGVSAVVAQ